MSNIVYIATSIDGFIAREDGSVEWLMEVPNPTDDDYGFSDFLARIDAIIMGRNTFQTAVGFGEWPYTKPVFVLSTTLQRVPDHLSTRAEIISGEVPAVIDALTSRGFRDFYVDGGRTIRGFLQRDMIDEMIITTIPVVLGSGIPLFGGTGKELKFTHRETIVYDNALVKSRYVRRRV